MNSWMNRMKNERQKMFSIKKVLYIIVTRLVETIPNYV